MSVIKPEFSRGSYLYQKTFVEGVADDPGCFSVRYGPLIWSGLKADQTLIGAGTSRYLPKCQSLVFLGQLISSGTWLALTIVDLDLLGFKMFALL